MATYVTSDAHGHLRALDRALELAAPGSTDTVYVLGDMIDRGPEPVGVLKLVRSLPRVRVLMGNHERMMLDALLLNEPGAQGGWELNGGWITAEQLDALPRDEFISFLAWIHGLPLFDVIEVEDRFAPRREPAGTVPVAQDGASPAPMRTYILCHAGIDALAARGYLATAGVPVDEPGGMGRATAEQLRDMLAAQDGEDLLWIRDRFWGEPTGFVGAAGTGPIVIAGHTPSILLGSFSGHVHGPLIDAAAHGLVVEVGACQDTGGVADRIDIDASAAGGFPHGQVAVMRLEDHRVWYAPVAEGE